METLTITCIVFDFDGTLSRLNIDFDSMRKRVSGLMEHYGLDSRRFSGLYVLEMVEAASAALADEHDSKARIAFTEEAYRLIQDIEMEGARRGNLFEGVTEMMGRLQRAHIRTGIITRNCLEAVCCVWPEIHSFCDALITRESAVRVKPDPAHLRQILTTFGATPSRSIMTGDHPMDIHVGKTVGTVTVGVLTGNSTEQALRGAGADYIIERASTIDNCLNFSVTRE